MHLNGSDIKIYPDTDSSSKEYLYSASIETTSEARMILN